MPMLCSNDNDHASLAKEILHSDDNDCAPLAKETTTTATTTVNQANV